MLHDDGSASDTSYSIFVGLGRRLASVRSLISTVIRAMAPLGEVGGLGCGRRWISLSGEEEEGAGDRLRQISLMTILGNRPSSRCGVNNQFLPLAM